MGTSSVLLMRPVVVGRRGGLFATVFIETCVVARALMVSAKEFLGTWSPDLSREGREALI